MFTFSGSWQNSCSITVFHVSCLSTLSIGSDMIFFHFIANLLCFDFCYQNVCKTTSSLNSTSPKNWTIVYLGGPWGDYLNYIYRFLERYYLWVTKVQESRWCFSDFEYGLLHFYVLYILFPVVKDRKIKTTVQTDVWKLTKCKNVNFKSKAKKIYYPFSPF